MDKLFRFIGIALGDTYLVPAKSEYLAWAELSKATGMSVEDLIEAGVLVSEVEALQKSRIIRN